MCEARTCLLLFLLAPVHLWLCAVFDRSTPCIPCYLTHTKARCITAASKVVALNLTASVSGQRSNPLPYLYADVVSSTPPNVVTVVVSTVASSSQLRTTGNDTVVIVGEFSWPSTPRFSVISLSFGVKRDCCPHVRLGVPCG